MNWKIIFQLSVFGLIMAVATVFLIPEKVEPVFWLAIFIFCAYIIARVVGRKHFLHGFCVSLVNCIWITGAHIIFYSTYIANHPGVAKMSADHPFLPAHPRLAMLIMGPVFGIVFGLILGLFAFIASFIVKKKVAAY
ncbi:MAG TPA: hypothetical protein VK671_03245 [Mucilaginibacter sp.]|nr:hypothetical protein [Mucilaginibacter sp.]